MLSILEKTSHFVINFFAMLVTLSSFVLLSLQILLMSLIWVLACFLNRFYEKTDQQQEKLFTKL